MWCGGHTGLCSWTKKHNSIAICQPQKYVPPESRPQILSNGNFSTILSTIRIFKRRICEMLDSVCFHRDPRRRTTPGMFALNIMLVLVEKITFLPCLYISIHPFSYPFYFSAWPGPRSRSNANVSAVQVQVPPQQEKTMSAHPQAPRRQGQGRHRWARRRLRSRTRSNRSRLPFTRWTGSKARK